MGCSPGPQNGGPLAATDPRTVAPTAPPSIPGSSPTSPPSASPSTAAPIPAPVPRTITGRATRAATGAGVAGVSVRVLPSPINDGRAPGPEVTAVTDDRGAYTLTVLTWSPEALGSSSSFQAMVQVTPPPGLLVLRVTNTLGGPPGSADGVLTGRPLIVSELSGPIDITLGPGHIVEGRVTSGLTGAPLAGIGVIALGPNSMLIYGGAGDAFEIEATATTDANGKYRLPVRSGRFVIFTYGPQGGSQQRFWTDDPAIFKAAPLTVERDVTGIDLALVPVTRIDGQIWSGGVGMGTVPGTRVAVYVGGGTACCRTVGVATTGSGGTFLMYVPQGTTAFCSIRPRAHRTRQSGGARPPDSRRRPT